MFSRVQMCKFLILSLLGGALTCSGTLATAASAVLIESAPDGWNHQWFKSDGIWLASTGKSKAPGLNGTSSLFNTADATPGKATFAPELPVEGQYEVFVTFSQFANSKGVKYRIVHAGGEADVVQDQNGLSREDRRADSWISLGTYQFKAGPGTQIEISDPGTGEPANSTETNVRVYADSVRLVPVGFSLPATFENKLAAGISAKAPVANSATPATASTPAPVAAPVAPQASVPPASQASSTAPAPIPPSLDSVSAPSSTLAPLPTANPPGSLAPAGIPQPLEPGLNQPQNADSGALPVLPELSSGASAAAPAPLPSNSSALPSLPDASPSNGTPAALPNLSAAAAAAPATGTNIPAPLSAGGTPPALGLPANLPSLSGDSRPPVSTSLPSALSDITGTPGSGSSGSSSNSSPLPLAPVNPIANSGTGAGLPSLAAASFGEPVSGLPSPSAPVTGRSGALGFGTGSSNASSAPSRPLATPALTPPPHEDDGTGIQWLYDYHAALSAARNQGKQVLVFFTARGNRVANRYTAEFFKDPVVRTALDRFLLVKLDFPMNTRLGYRLGIFGAGQIAVVNGDDTKVGAITQMPASPAEFVSALDAIK